MSSRSPEVQAAYEDFNRSYTGNYVFCDVKQRAPNAIVRETKSMYILRNQFPYAQWDNLEIAEHLMLVPQRHVLTLSELSDDEKTDFLEQLVYFEESGYSVYLRAQANRTRTVGHLHAHLLKPMLQ